MAERPKHIFSKLTEAEAPLLNENIARAYRLKTEGKLFRNTSASYIVAAFQEHLYGQVTYSACDAATTSIATIIPFDKTYNRVLYADAHANTLGMEAVVTDITACQITVNVVARAASAATVSAIITTACHVFSWQAVCTME